MHDLTEWNQQWHVKYWHSQENAQVMNRCTRKFRGEQAANWAPPKLFIALCVCTPMHTGPACSLLLYAEKSQIHNTANPRHDGFVVKKVCHGFPGHVRLWMCIHVCVLTHEQIKQEIWTVALCHHCCLCGDCFQGAGDAFIGALAFYLSTQPDMPLSDVIHRANEIATRSVLASGTQKSFPWRSQLPSELFSPSKNI